MKHRYDLIGQRLKDRNNELATNMDLLDKHKKQYEGLTHWIDGQKRKLSDRPLPSNKDEASKNLNEIKVKQVFFLPIQTVYLVWQQFTFFLGYYDVDSKRTFAFGRFQSKLPRTNSFKT